MKALLRSLTVALSILLVAFSIGCRQSVPGAGLDPDPKPITNLPPDYPDTLEAPTNLQANVVSIVIADEEEPSGLNNGLTSLKIQVTWKDPLFEDDFNLEVELRGPGELDYTKIGTVAKGKQIYTYPLGQLTTQNLYAFRLRAVSATQTSSYSPVVTATAGQDLLAAPINISASLTAANNVKLMWAWSNAQTSSIQSIIVRRKSTSSSVWVDVGNPAFASSMIWNDTNPNAIAGTIHYQVAVVYTNGTSATRTSGIVFSKLNMPTGLIASDILQGYHTVSWANISLAHDGYILKYKVGATGTETILPLQTASTKDVACTAGTTMYYAVKAKATGTMVADSNYTAFINRLCPTNVTTLPVPQNFHIYPTGGETMQLDNAWYNAGNINYVNAVEYYRVKEPAGAPELIYSTGDNTLPTSFEDTTITGYYGSVHYYIRVRYDDQSYSANYPSIESEHIYMFHPNLIDVDVSTNKHDFTWNDTLNNPAYVLAYGIQYWLDGNSGSPNDLGYFPTSFPYILSPGCPTGHTISYQMMTYSNYTGNSYYDSDWSTPVVTKNCP